MPSSAFERALEQGKKLASKIRSDGWVNALTSIGTSRDKARHTRFEAVPPLSIYELDDLFNGDDLANTIVSKVVDDALRDGFKVKRKSAKSKSEVQDSQETAELLCNRLKELKLKERLHDAAVWGRLFGGGALMLGLNGAGDPSTPLDLDTLGDFEIEFIDDADRSELVVRSWDVYGNPETYWYNPVVVGQLQVTQVIVHVSRIVMFPGVKTSHRAKARNEGWDHSVLQRCYNVLRSVNTQWDSVTHMFTDMSQAVLKMNGLLEAMAEDDQKTVEKRAQFTDMMRSVARMIVLDNGNSDQGENPEEFEVVERGALTGVDGILQQSFIRLACCARMPATVLLGQSPAGMDATGDSDQEIWKDEVQGERGIIDPRAQVVLELVCLEQGEDPDDWELDWPPLRQVGELDQSTIDLNRVNALGVLIDKTVVLPEEGALSLEKLVPEMELEIDLDARKAALIPALEALKNPPPDPNATPADPNDPNKVADPNAPVDPNANSNGPPPVK